MEEFIQKGKEIESNLQKALYCNRKDRPREIFAATKWYLLLFLAAIIAYILIIRGCHDFGTGFLWTLLFIGLIGPAFIKYQIRKKEVKNENKERGEYLKGIYQETFNAFVFSEYIERRLLSVGVIHSAHDQANEDDPERSKFYHYYRYRKEPLKYKYTDVETEWVEGFSGFSFKESIWAFGPFCYRFQKRAGNDIAVLIMDSRKKIENEVLIFRKNSGYRLNDDEAKIFRKYEMDNSRFNDKFDIYAINSIELFKIFTPAYMEKILQISETRGIGLISIKGSDIEVALDSNFPLLKNPYLGFNVQQALASAESSFQYFMSFMNDFSAIGI